MPTHCANQRSNAAAGHERYTARVTTGREEVQRAAPVLLHGEQLQMTA